MKKQNETLLQVHVRETIYQFYLFTFRQKPPTLHKQFIIVVYIHVELNYQGVSPCKYNTLQ